ncbi:MAG: hypothetical protein FD118_4175 [Rhodocyclaceae bacterium]|nr:MAG: hypothetical protein FD118_4175 [Rhodocyclaceae bacterium]
MRIRHSHFPFRHSESFGSQREDNRRILQGIQHRHHWRVWTSSSGRSAAILGRHLTTSVQVDRGIAYPRNNYRLRGLQLIPRRPFVLGDKGLVDTGQAPDRTDLHVVKRNENDHRSRARPKSASGTCCDSSARMVRPHPFDNQRSSSGPLRPKPAPSRPHWSRTTHDPRQVGGTVARRAYFRAASGLEVSTTSPT